MGRNWLARATLLGTMIFGSATAASAAEVIFNGSMSGTAAGALAPSCAPLPRQSTLTGPGTSSLGDFAYWHQVCLAGVGPIHGNFLFGFSGGDTLEGTIDGAAVANATAGLFDIEGDMPVPHYWEHVMWVWGQPNLDSFMELMERVNLNGHLHNIKVPFLVTHGGHDRQIPLRYAEQSYEQAVNSPDRELKVFTPREGGIEHCGADNMEPVQNFIGDWLADRFAKMGV